MNESFMNSVAFIIWVDEAGGGFLANTFLSRWFNLLLFVGVLVFLLRKPLANFLQTRRDGIHKDLIRAQEERAAALAKLEQVEVKLARLNLEIATVRVQAEQEAQAERERLATATENEIKKMREQSQRDIENAAKQARHALRLYAAEQSVQLAEEVVRRNIQPEDDRRLVGEYVTTLKGARS